MCGHKKPAYQVALNVLPGYRSRGLRTALFVGSLLVAHAGNAATQPVTGVSYPVKPIRVVVATAAGGGIDTVARKVGAKLTEAWGQPVVVDNRAGGAQTIGTDIVAKALPDGYTLLVISSTHAIIPGLFPKLPFDAIRDFAPITMLASAPNLLVVHPAIPARTLKEFIALAKTKPRQMNYGSSGNGSLGHLGMEMLKSMTGIDLAHIPYKGAAPALTAVLSGEVSVQISQIITVVPQVRAGRLRALGITSSRRSQAVPDVPTISEAGAPGFEGSSWFGVVAPSHTPQPIVAKLNAELVRIMNLPDIHAQFTNEGADPVGDKPEEFALKIRSDIAKWGKVIKAVGIVAD